MDALSTQIRNTLYIEREREIMRVSKNHAKKSGGRIGRADGSQLFLARGRPAVVDYVSSQNYSSVLKYYTVVNKSKMNF